MKLMYVQRANKPGEYRAFSINIGLGSLVMRPEVSKNTTTAPVQIEIMFLRQHLAASVPAYYEEQDVSKMCVTCYDWLQTASTIATLSKCAL